MTGAETCRCDAGLGPQFAEDCPVHGGATVSESQPHSVPPSDLTIAPCLAHGVPFAFVDHKIDGSPWKIFTDGCEEPL